MIFFALSVNITPGPSLIMFSFLTLLIVLASGAEIRLSNARRRAETQSLEPWFSWTLSSQHNVIAGLTLLIIIRKVRWPRGRSILISGHSVIAFSLCPYQPQPETPYHPLYPLVHLSPEPGAPVCMAVLFCWSPLGPRSATDEEANPGKYRL